jgi:ribosomal protein S18 acetylase RimI-like enzyme
MISVRPAEPGDGPTLLRMTQELSKTHFPMSESVVAENYEVALFRPDPIIGAFVALVDGVAAGSAIWHRSFSTNKGAEVMYLEDVAVLPEFRRMGVAKLLLHEICKLAVAKGYPKVFWLAMEWNEGAIALYRSIGAGVEKANCYCWIEGEAMQSFAASP